MYVNDKGFFCVMLYFLSYIMEDLDVLMIYEENGKVKVIGDYVM